MKPSQGKCQHCVHYSQGWCKSLADTVESWWTGCVRWRDAKENPKSIHMSQNVQNIDTFSGYVDGNDI
jgi:hypothetical protein